MTAAKKNHRNPKALSGQRVLMIVNRVDLEATQNRVLLLAVALARAGVRVELMTHNEDAAGMMRERVANVENMQVTHNPPKPIYWNPQHRDDIVRGYLKQNSDLTIPGTDMRYWKCSAFDDFRGHVSAHTYTELGTGYDAIMVAVPSVDEALAIEADVLMSNCLFHAREHGIPTIGLQINPARQAPRIYQKLLDHFVVRSEQEKQLHVRNGVSPDRVSVITDPKDRYCIETIEDVYRGMSLDDRVPNHPDELFVTILNHSKYRAPIIQAINVIGKLPFPATVCLVKVLFEVRDLHEDQVIDELIKPHLEKLKKQYYLTDVGALSKMLMISDVMVSTTYVTPVSFAAKYAKGAVVYNPMKSMGGADEGIDFVTQADELRRVLTQCYERKRAQRKFVDVIAGILA